jgi:hypothetical protein
MGTALSSAHMLLTSARFNPGSLLAPSAQFATLSFADDSDVAAREVEAVFQSLAIGIPSRVANPSRNWFLTLNVRVVLDEVFDLTDVSSAQVPLGTNAQELPGDWMGYVMRTHSHRVSGPSGVAPTQELGFELFRTGIEGFRSISAKQPSNKTLTIFPKNFRKNSSVTRTDSSGKVVAKIP